MANEETVLVCPYKVVKHSYGDSDFHILIELSLLPLTILKFGKMANDQKNPKIREEYGDYFAEIGLYEKSTYEYYQ